MGVLTNFLNLLKPEENDYYNSQTEQAENWEKIDNWAEENQQKIDEIYEKFKNFCPFPVNSLYLSLGSENPSTLWLGTTWQKQEGKFLLGSSSTYILGTTGGNSTIKLSVDNLPSHTHSATTASHSHTQPNHTHRQRINGQDGNTQGSYISGTTYYASPFNSNLDTTSAGGETTGSASPITTIGNTGKGTTFSIMPPYIAVNIWKRLS